VGRMASGQEMKQTPNTEHRTSNAEFQKAPSEFDVRHLGVQRSLRYAVSFLIAAVFIYAGIVKAWQPAEFARDIDNYKMVSWPVAVAFAFYLPWLEILCGISLFIPRVRGGSIFILTSLTIAFIVASVVAKARGLDISCGCFGHVSQGWSFGRHLALDFGVLAGLLILSLGAKRTANSTSPSPPSSVVSPHL
jgi:putative oxidoreductase